MRNAERSEKAGSRYWEFRLFSSTAHSSFDWADKSPFVGNVVGGEHLAANQHILQLIFLSPFCSYLSDLFIYISMLQSHFFTLCIIGPLCKCVFGTPRLVLLLAGVSHEGEGPQEPSPFQWEKRLCQENIHLGAWLSLATLLTNSKPPRGLK